MKYISRPLRNEVREKYKVFSNVHSLNRIIKCRNLRMKAIEKNAQISSYRIENPKEGVPFSVPRNKQKEKIREGIHNLERAFEWGSEHFTPSDFDENFVKEIAGKILPNVWNRNKASYRQTGTNIVGATTTPPYPYKIEMYEMPRFIDSLKKQLECTDVINRIESAIFAHLHLVRMHPFVDGNGRTARTIQDIILDYYGIPVPIIEAGERHTYYQILDKAIFDWKEKMGSGEKVSGSTYGERLLYDFMAGKINVSLDKILSSCYTK